MRAVAFDPAGQILATGHEKGEVRLWRTATGAQVKVVAETGKRIESLSFSPDGGTLVVGTWGGGAKYLDVVSGRLLHGIGAGIVSSVAFSPTGNVSAVRSWEGVMLLDSNGKVLADLKVLAGYGAGGLAFAGDGKALFAGSGKESVMIWEIPDKPTRDGVWPLISEQVLPGDSPVDGIVFDQAGRTITTSTYDGGVRTWDISRKSYIRKSAPRQTHGDGYDRIAYSADGKIVVRGSENGNIAVWDSIGPKLLVEQSITKDNSPVTALALSADGKILATGDCVVWATLGCREGRVRVWDLAEVPQSSDVRLRPRNVVEKVHGNALALAFGPGEQTLVVGFPSGTTTIYLTAKQASTTSQFSPEAISGLVFSADQRWIASLNDRIIELSEYTKDKVTLQHSLDGHKSKVSAAAFSRDGTLLASGDDDGGVILWTVDSGLKLGEFRVASKTIVRSVAFSPDGRVLAAGGWDGSLTLWERDADEGLARACRIANRTDIPDQWRHRVGKSASESPTCGSRK